MDVIYLAAGIGKRTNLTKPKQFHTFFGKPIFIYALEVLEKHKSVQNILITYNKKYIGEYEKILDSYNINNYQLIEGGETRQESVFNALKHVKTNNVLVHEAARPMISKEFLDEIIEVKGYKAVVPVVPINFTVSIGDVYLESLLKRDTLKNIQLPQLFDTSTLIRAHENAMIKNYQSTEDSTLIHLLGEKVRFILGRESNIKITTERDLILMEGYLNEK